MDRPHPGSRMRLRAALPAAARAGRQSDTTDERRPPGWNVARRMVVPVLVVLGILLLALLAWQLRQLILLVFVSLLFAAGLHDPARWLERRGLPRGLAAIIPFVVLAAIITGLLVIIFPPLITQAGQLIENLPTILDALLRTLVGTVDRLVGVGTGQQVADQLTEEVAGFTPDVAALAMLPLTLFEVLIAAGTVLFLSVLLLLERDTAAAWFLQFLDPQDRGGATDLGRNVLQKLGAYVRGQLVVMSLVGIATTAGMLVLGVPFALPLGVFAFATEAIPIVGPWISAVPILAVALLESPMTGALMAGWLLVVQQAEGFLLTPLVQGKVLSLSPIAVLLAVFAGGALAGIVGAIIAVPLLAVVDVLIREVVIPLRSGRGSPSTPEATSKGVSP